MAICINEGTIVFGMVGHKVDEGLETCAATSGNLDVFRGFEQCLHFAQFSVELYDINLLDAVLEEAVDGGVEVPEVIFRDASATVHPDNHVRCEVVAASHGVEA